MKNIMKKLTGDECLLIGIMVATLVYGLSALSYPDLKTKLIPGMASGIAFGLAAIKLWMELSQKKEEAKEAKPVQQTEATGDAAEDGGDEDEFTESSVAWRQNAIVFSWLAGFVVAIYLVGFIVSTLLLVFLYLKSHGYRWLKSGVVAVVATATIYLVFESILNANLFQGIIMEALAG